MRILKKTFLAMILSAALLFPGLRQPFSGMEWLQTLQIAAPESTLPPASGHTGMSRSTDGDTVFLPGSVREHLQDGTRHDSASRPYLFLPARLSLFVPLVETHRDQSSSGQCSRLFLSCGVIRRKLIPRSDPFFIL